MFAIGSIFHEILVRPLFNLLVGIYDVLPFDDLGVAIVLLTVLTRLVFFPLSHKALISQRRLSDLQPLVKELQQKHKGQRAEQSRAVMALYKEHRINPFAGIVPMLIQLPILFALYRVFLQDLNADSLRELYSFVPAPDIINTSFLGLIDMTSPSPILAILAGFFMFLQSKITFSQRAPASSRAGGDGKPDFQRMMAKQMMYVMPFFIIVISWNFPAGLPLYWATTTLFSFLQQYSINRKTKPANAGASRSYEPS